VLHIRFLGEQAITAASGTIRVRSSRTVALAAFLVLHAELPQPRSRIASLFWPDSNEAQALTNLRRELHHLRNALDGDPALVVTARDLCWRDSETCTADVRLFSREYELALATDGPERLTHANAAIGHYRGEFLPGGFDDWLLEARTELEDRCVQLLDLVSAARAEAGEMRQAVDAMRRRIELRPLEEIGYRRLMQWQSDLGERAAAVSTYHHCASVLERELGVEPDPATRALLNQLLSRAEPPARTASATPTAQAATGRSGHVSSHLVGRSREVAVLDALWRTAAAGRPTLALIRGDAGVGKTRLVSELAARARSQGAIVASAQCFGTSGRLALAPVADWLRVPAIQSGRAALEPFWRAEVDRLVPSGQATAGGQATPDGRATAGGQAAGDTNAAGLETRTMVDEWQRHRFFEGLARALIGAGRPTLLILDNLQWCDPETLALVTFCLGLTDDAPLMVAATMRSDDDRDDRDLVEWRSRVRATSMAAEVTVGPLDAADTARLAGSLSGRALPPDAAQLLQATTGGFPLYIVEAIRSAVDLTSEPFPLGDLSAVLRNRLEQVTPAARDIAGLAAAVGRNFTLDLLTEASDLDADTVVEAVDELWRHRIVREIGDGYDFSHDLVRDYAYDQVSPPRRWLLHRRVAQGLELLNVGDPDAVSAQLAEQYARGGRAERAVGHYRRAGELAAGMFAHAEAIRLDQAALAIVADLAPTRERKKQELDLLEALAAPLNARLGYSSPQLRDALQRAIALAEELGEHDSLVVGLVGLWTSHFVQGNTSAGFDTATRVLALVEPDSALSGTAHFAFGGSALSVGRPAEAVRHLELAATFGATQALTVGTRADVHGRAFAAHAHWLLGDDDQAAASSAAAIALARTTANPYCLTVALAYAGITHQLRADGTALVATVDELRELCDRYNFAYYREWVLILDGWSRTDGTGAGLAQRGVENLTAQGSFARMPYWLSLLADASARNGRPDAAQAFLDAALVRARAGNDVWWLPEVMRMRAAYDEQPEAILRLRAAALIADNQGSLALRRRCAADLAGYGASPAG
jgi:DNA-binding SARP family transcriptional activator